MRGLPLSQRKADLKRLINGTGVIPLYQRECHHRRRNTRTNTIGLLSVGNSDEKVSLGGRTDVAHEVLPVQSHNRPFRQR
jgi:hypothetical protein